MPTQSAKRASGRKRRGGRRPVSFVTHPDTDRSVGGLRFHKPSNRYYRIDEDSTRVYYGRKGLRGVQYLRRAIYEHECWQRGNEPSETVALPIRHPTFDDFGTEITPVASFDDQGLAVNVHYVSQEDLAAYVREQPGEHEFQVEVADTNASRMRGLMGRTALADDAGMLFIFDEPQVLPFWMSNTSIPLDIAFIREDMIVSSIDTMMPFSLELHVSIEPVPFALEVPAGEFSRRGIEAGDEVVFEGVEIEKASALRHGLQRSMQPPEFAN